MNTGIKILLAVGGAAAAVFGYKAYRNSYPAKVGQSPNDQPFQPPPINPFAAYSANFPQSSSADFLPPQFQGNLNGYGSRFGNMPSPFPVLRIPLPSPNYDEDYKNGYALGAQDCAHSFKRVLASGVSDAFSRGYLAGRLSCLDGGGRPAIPYGSGGYIPPQGTGA